MIITLDFVISAVAVGLAIRVKRLGREFYLFFLFLIFASAASFAGGCSHLIMKYAQTAHSLIMSVNAHLPSVLQINILQFKTRLWYLTVVLVGFAQCFFFFLLRPILIGKLKYIEYCFLFMLGFFVLFNLFVDHYLIVIAFYVMAQTIFILLSLYVYFKHRESAFLWLPFLGIYNILAGIVQQLMMRGYLPTGPLQYNDWYHLLVIAFLFITYYAMVTKQIAKKLDCF